MPHYPDEIEYSDKYNDDVPSRCMPGCSTGRFQNKTKQNKTNKLAAQLLPALERRQQPSTQAADDGAGLSSRSPPPLPLLALLRYHQHTPDAARAAFEAAASRKASST